MIYAIAAIIAVEEAAAAVSAFLYKRCAIGIAMSTRRINILVTNKCTQIH